MNFNIDLPVNNVRSNYADEQENHADFFGFFNIIMSWGKKSSKWVSWPKNKGLREREVLRLLPWILGHF